jgi:hypothetical protein
MTTPNFPILPRLHIVPIGFEYDRILFPLGELKAESVIFIQHKDPTKGQPFLNRVLEKIKIRYFLKSCDLFDWDSILLLLSNLYAENCEKFEMFVNVSSGSKIFAMAAYHAALIGKFNLYYVLMENYIPKGEHISENPIDILPIPLIKIRKPNPKYIKFLKIVTDYLIEENRRFITKKETIKKIPYYPETKLSKSGYNRLMKEYLNPMIQWGFISFLPNYQHHYKITHTGRQYLDIYQNFYRIERFSLREINSFSNDELKNHFNI